MYKTIIVNTFDTLFKNSNNLIQKLLIPIIIISGINYYIPQFFNYEMLNTKSLTSMQSFDIKTSLIPIFLIFTLIMVNISIAITTHRIVILGDKSVPKLGSYIFGLREFKFLFKSILMGIIITIPVIASVFIPFAGIFIAAFLLLIMFSRLSFVYPAISCDEKMSFYQAWKHTKNYKILSLFTIILFPVIFAITVGFVYTIAIEFLIKLVSPHLTVLYSLLNVFIMVFSISALSSAYLYIKPRQLNKPIQEVYEELRDIIESSRKGIHKVIIHDKHKVTFDSLKKELLGQYKKLNFTEIAYDRRNTFLLKNPDNIEAYVSLRLDNDEFTILVNKTDKPVLKILR